MKRCLIYARVSTTGQAESGTSLDSQVRECRAYAEAHGFEIAHVCEEVFSGANLFDRPLLNRQRELIKQGEYDAVVVFAVDRLSRDIAHVAIIANELERYNTELHFVSEPLDATPEGKLILSVKSYAAEIERVKIIERCVRGKKTKWAKGEFVPGGDLYGYRYNRAEKKRKIHPSEARIVRRIFEETAAGYSLRSIGKRLNAEGVPPPSADKRTFADGRAAIWHYSALRRIIREPAYTGKTYASRFKLESYYKNGSRKSSVTVRPPEEWVELPDDITPPIIEKGLWESVQAKLSSNTGERTRNEQKPFLLRGIAFCAVCGQKLYPETEKRTTRIYRCSSRSYGRKKCTGRRLNAERVERAVWQVVKKAVENPSLIEAQLDKYYARHGSQRQRMETELERMRKSRAALNSQIDNLVARAADADNATWKLFDKHIKDRQKQLAALGVSIAELETTLSAFTEKKIDILSRAAAFREKVENADFETKRAILDSFNTKVFGSGKNIQVYTDWMV